MTSIVIASDGVSVNHYEWPGSTTIRISDAVKDATVEIALNETTPAVRVSLADLRAWVGQREDDPAIACARAVANNLRLMP